MNQEQIMQQLQAGMQALQSGNLDAAENVFRNILSVDSSEVHSLHFLGVVFCQKGNLNDGVALIEQSIRLDPSRFGPYLNLGRFLVGANQWDRAVAALEQAIQRDASSFDAWSMLAQASFFAGCVDAALKAGKTAAEIDPGNAEIFFSLGVYASGTNKDEAIDHYRNAVSIDPASFKAWVNLGNCLLDCQHVEDSIAAFNEALKTDPSCLQALLGLCRAYGDLGNWLDALDMAKQALSLEPSSHDAAFLVGFSLHKLERKQDAVNAYRAALNISPVAAQTHLYLASALEGLGEDQHAIEHYEMATNIDPDLSLAFTFWGALLLQGGELSLAIDKFRLAIDSDPSAADAYLVMGTALHQLGQPDEAISNYRKAIEAKNDFADAYRNLASLFHEENELNEALRLYALAFQANGQLSDCRFHLCVAGVEDLANSFMSLQSCMTRLSQQADDLLQEDLLILRCLCDFSRRWGMGFEFPKTLSQDVSSVELSARHSPSLRDLLEAYALCRQSTLPRWIQFEDNQSPFLLLSDYLESLRIKGDFLTGDWMALKDYQFSMTSVDAYGLPSADQLFVKVIDRDECLWLSAERFQFPDLLAVLSLRDSLFKKSSLPSASMQDQSEFLRKAHLLDAQKFYMADADPCLHGVSELYRVHRLIADTIKDIEGLKGVVDLGYYSCGIFNAGLMFDLKCFCIEPARHHAVWVAESGIAEVVPDVPERCVRSFEEYVSRLDAVSLDDPGATTAVISFILQLFEYEQCVEILRRVKKFASHLVITDDILNEESEESILRLLSNGKRMNLCHNYQRLLSDAGWRIEKKWYFHGVRYASGIIVAIAA